MTDPKRLDAYNSPEGAVEYFEEYEKLHRKLSDGRERRILDSFFEHTGKVETILDLPAGWGRYHPYLLEHAERLYGSDWSADMLTMVQSLDRASTAGLFRSLGTEIALRDGTIDLVFSMRLNHHLTTQEDRLAHLQECMRVASRFVIFSYFDYATLKNRIRQMQRLWSSKIAKNTLRYREMVDAVHAGGYRVVSAPLLFPIGSGHRLVLLERDPSSN